MKLNLATHYHHFVISCSEFILPFMFVFHEKTVRSGSIPQLRPKHMHSAYVADQERQMKNLEAARASTLIVSSYTSFFLPA